MNGKNDISEELRSVSALVASISRQTPYEVPEGYFFELPAAVMQRVKAWEQTKSLKFSVPEGYFEGLAQQVLNRIKFNVGPAGRAVGDSRVNVGPEGRAVVDSRANGPAGKAEESEALPAVLLQAGRRTPYQTPEGYFDGLAPLLSVIRDKNPYLVPEGYFEQVPAGVLGGLRTVGLEKGKVRSLGGDGNGSRIRRMSWVRYSAAAVVAGLILTAGWLRFGPGVMNSLGIVPAAGNGKTSVDLARTMSKVSDEELKSYLADQDTTLAQPIGNLATAANVDMNDSDVKDLLGNVSDGELTQYMEEHGEAMDIATN